MEIGKNVVICRNVRFCGDGTIKLNDGRCIGDDTTIFASKEAGVEIGENTFIAANCYIIDMNHGYAKGKPVSQCKDSYDKVIIGNNVWLGQDVTILKGSKIEDGVVIGAKSLVNSTIPKETIAAGIPAKVIKNK